MEYTVQETCRLCHSNDIQLILSLGDQYVVDFIKSTELNAWRNGERENPVPMNLMICKQCKFVQLRETVNPDRLYRKFWYKSGINESMRRQLHEIVQKATAKVRLVHDPLIPSVLDIGCNDGTLLAAYGDAICKVGFDPATNLTAEAKKTAKTEFIFDDYFTKAHAGQLKALAPDGFKVITAISMFYDLQDPRAFLELVRQNLQERGVFVIQMNYLLTMLLYNAVDNIAHEHLGYYSLTVLKQLVESCGMNVCDAELNDTNGGSIRVYINHAGLGISISAAKRVWEILQIEEASKLDNIQTYLAFRARIEEIKTAVRMAIYSHSGKVYLYGASTRGSTLMQLLNLPASSIVGVAERNPEKVGLHMVGTWLPIVSESVAREDATMFLILPWHFKTSILERERASLEQRGIKFLFPLPYPHIYSVDRLT